MVDYYEARDSVHIGQLNMWYTFEFNVGGHRYHLQTSGGDSTLMLATPRAFRPPWAQRQPSWPFLQFLEEVD